MSDRDPDEPGWGGTSPQGWAPPAGAQPPPPYPPPGYYPPPAPPGSSTNGFAIAALILGIVGGFLLSIIFGIIALRQIKRTGQSGKGLAIAGVVLGVVWIVIVGAVATYFVAGTAERDMSGTITDGGDVMVQDLEVGDCLNSLEEQAVVLSVDGVACSAPHDAEVYAAIELPEGEFPGMEAMTADAEQRCADDLASNHPEAYEDQAVDLFYFHPTAASWREGDREINCVALYTEPRTGSLQD